MWLTWPSSTSCTVGLIETIQKDMSLDHGGRPILMIKGMDIEYDE